MRYLEVSQAFLQLVKRALCTNGRVINTFTTHPWVCVALITLTASSEFTHSIPAYAGAVSLNVYMFCTNTPPDSIFLAPFPDCKMCQQVIRISFFLSLHWCSYDFCTSIFVWNCLYLGHVLRTLVCWCVCNMYGILGSQKKRRVKRNHKKLTKDVKWDSSHFLQLNYKYVIGWE